MCPAPRAPAAGCEADGAKIGGFEHRVVTRNQGSRARGASQSLPKRRKPGRCAADQICTQGLEFVVPERLRLMVTLLESHRQPALVDRRAFVVECLCEREVPLERARPREKADSSQIPLLV